MENTSYIKLYDYYLDAIEPLQYDEIGRLFTALLTYARAGETIELEGNERILFPVMKAQLEEYMVF